LIRINAQIAAHASVPVQQKRFLQSKCQLGKGLPLAFFLLLLCLPFFKAGADFPLIRRLDPTDTGFRQFSSDVEANRRRLAVVASRQTLDISAQGLAEHLTIYQYTVRPEEDLFFLAARSNIPYSALASLNRINNPAGIEAGKTILLPSCPGIFIPSNSQSDLEIIISAARAHAQGSVELKIRIAGTTQTFLFFPGADFTPTERAYFLNSGFRFPLRNFRVTSSFGIRNDPFHGHLSMHQGIDLAAPEGTEVYAIADGVVTAAGFDPVYGNYVIISHSNRWTSLYGHLQIIETTLRSDVRSGTLIGRVGSTGQSTGPHLHFELRQDGRAFDPAGRLRP
jgi:murein DD-endopeptidase MepM/ murein hydrolase activator NlpD